MRVLLATDGSEYSVTAAKYLRRLPLGHDVEVFVLHALKEYLIPDAIDPARDFVKAGKRGAQALVEEFRKDFVDAGVKAHALVREGEPWREIIECAEEVKADLIVMGHRGMTGIESFLMGSVTNQVLRHGHLSVLVVRELPPSEGPMRILYSTNGSPASRYAMDLLVRLPFDAMTTGIRVLSVVDMEVTSLPEKYYPDEEISLMMVDLREHNRKAAEKSVSEDAAELKHRFFDVSQKVVFGIPESEILNEIKAMDADLVVLGSKGIIGLKGVILGSVSNRVVKHADCGILVARQPER
jgi:nucleotide-binding universal stress UspA family protein